jgi:plastocyanin
MRLIKIMCLVTLAASAVACGNSNDSPTAPTPPNGSTSVSIVSGASALTTTAYTPNPISIAVGGTVTWINNDTTAHTATANGGAFDTGSIAPGGNASKTFSTAGSFPYRCTIHPGMVGTITVQ